MVPFVCGVSFVKHEVFEPLVKGAFCLGMSDQDFMAILKRCVYVVIVDKMCFIRTPSAEKVLNSDWAIRVARANAGICCEKLPGG